MGQLGFFDADKRLAAISAKGDPLEMIDRVVPFESFRAEIEAAVVTPADEKRSNAGRKRIDVIVMFRMLVLQEDRMASRSTLRSGCLRTIGSPNRPPRCRTGPAAVADGCWQPGR
jgi:hypothetical protein